MAEIVKKNPFYFTKNKEYIHLHTWKNTFNIFSTDIPIENRMPAKLVIIVKINYRIINQETNTESFGTFSLSVADLLKMDEISNDSILSLIYEKSFIKKNIHHLTLGSPKCVKLKVFPVNRYNGVLNKKYECDVTFLKNGIRILHHQQGFLRVKVNEICPDLPQEQNAKFYPKITYQFEEERMSLQSLMEIVYSFEAQIQFKQDVEKN